MEEKGWPPSPVASAWYTLVDDGSLRQGDVLRGIKIPRLGDALTAASIDSGALPVAVSEGTVIILSPSCDLEQNRVRTGVLVARVWPATEEVLGASKRSDYRKRLELLRQDGYASRFLLPASDAVTPAFPWSFVDWRQPYFLPKSYIESLLEGSRLRLRHPIREKFGLWAGQRISEVGIETTHAIDRFISIGGAGDVLEAREAHRTVPEPSEIKGESTAEKPSQNE